jgi:antitoxin ParD1/3/4
MPSRTKQLNVSITPHFSNFIRRRVTSGRYSNASEVVREALRRLEQEEMVGKQTMIVDPEGTREAVLEGFASIERGESSELKGDAELKEFFEDVVSRGKKRLAARTKAAGAASVCETWRQLRQ